MNKARHTIKSPVIWSHLWCEISTIGKCTATENRRWLPEARGEEGRGSNCLMNPGFPFGVMKCFGTRKRWWLYNIVIILNATKLFTLKWLILCYMNYTWKISKEVSSSRTLQSVVCKNYCCVFWHALMFCLDYSLKIIFCAITLNVIWMQENHNQPKVEEFGKKVLCREIKFWEV